VVLGEAYLATGRTDSAVEHLRAAVDADPENRRATELLETASRPLN